MRSHISSVSHRSRASAVFLTTCWYSPRREPNTTNQVVELRAASSCEGVVRDAAVAKRWCWTSGGEGVGGVGGGGVSPGNQRILIIASLTSTALIKQRGRSPHGRVAQCSGFVSLKVWFMTAGNRENKTQWPATVPATVSQASRLASGSGGRKRGVPVF